MITPTPTTAPCPVDAFLKLSSQESSARAEVVCATNSNEPCRIPVRVGLFFDGTNNNMNRDLEGERTALDGVSKIAQRPLEVDEASHSNVARLYLAFTQDKPSSGYFRYYIPGVGTPFPLIGEAIETDHGKAFAKGGQARIIWAIFRVLDSLYRTVSNNSKWKPPDKFGELAQKHVEMVGSVERNMDDGQSHRMTHREWFEPYLQELRTKLASTLKPKIPKLTISVFGFSRGAAEAAAFCHYLAELFSDKCLVGIETSIDFLGLFDTVASVGMSDSAGRTTIVPNALFDGHWAWANKILKPLPECVIKGRHYIAAHEQRMNFPVTQIKGANDDFIEVYFAGVHSDVGGGYAPGEMGKARGSQSAMLSQIPLAYMFKDAREAGVPLQPFSLFSDRLRQDYLVRKDLATAWNAYTAELGTGGSVIKKHMQLYYRWRAARLKTLVSTASFLAATPQAQEDLRSSNDMLIGDLEALRIRKQFKYPRTAKQIPALSLQDMSRINHWHLYRLQNEIPLDEWESWALSIFDKPEPLPPDVMRFFDDYVHDSLAGFYLAGAVTEFDKRKNIAEAKSSWWKNKFEMKILALADKLEKAQNKKAQGQPLTQDEIELLQEAEYSTPYPLMTDKDARDMRDAVITTQTYTRREGGGYILRRSYYPKEGFFIRKSIHEKDLERDAALMVAPSVDGGDKIVVYDFVWSDDLEATLALHSPVISGPQDRMTA